jgi:glutamyl-tRNA synthetase
VSGDVLDFDDFFVADSDLKIDEAAFDKRVRKPAGARDLLGRYREMLAQAEPFTSQVLEQRTHDFVEANGIKIGDIVHAVRVAVTGKAVGFGLFETLAILGRERCLARIDRAIQWAANPPQSVF